MKIGFIQLEMPFLYGSKVHIQIFCPYLLLCFVVEFGLDFALTGFGKPHSSEN